MLISKRQQRLRRSKFLRWFTNLTTAAAVAVMSIFPNGVHAGGLRSVQVHPVQAQPVQAQPAASNVGKPATSRRSATSATTAQPNVARPNTASGNRQTGSQRTPPQAALPATTLPATTRPATTRPATTRPATTRPATTRSTQQNTSQSRPASSLPNFLQSIFNPTSSSTETGDSSLSNSSKSSTGRASQRRNSFAKPSSRTYRGNSAPPIAVPAKQPTVARAPTPAPTPTLAIRPSGQNPNRPKPGTFKPTVKKPVGTPRIASSPTPATRTSPGANQIPTEFPLVVDQRPRRLQADLSEAAPIIGSDASVPPKTATAFTFSDNGGVQPTDLLDNPAPIVDAPVVNYDPHLISDRAPQYYPVYTSPQTRALREAAKRSNSRAASDPLSDRTPASGHSGPLKSYKLMEYQDNQKQPPRKPFQVVERAGEFTLQVRRSRILRSDFDIYRTAVVDSKICEVTQFTPREVAIVGKSHGTTEVTFWMAGEDRRPATFLITVTPDVTEVRRQEDEYVLLEQLLRRQFPNSKVELTVIANKLIVEGQVRDAEEAAQILTLLRSENFSSRNLGGRSGLGEGEAVAVLPKSATGRDHNGLQIMNMLKIPGIQQVALKVKIAKLVRSAGRNMGIKFNADIGLSDSNTGALLLESLASANASPSVLARFDAGDIEIGLDYLESKGVVRVLAEPTLVAQNGRVATFHSGGEFAVPTVVGSAGGNAVSTEFKAFGTMLTFQPTILDKDRIQIQLSPEFSQIDAGNSVGGTPGTSTTNVSTTVIMREGQTMAIASLLDESFTASRAGSIPWLSQLLGPRSASRNETELIILVTPELVHPMDAEQVPPLPGFDVVEPTPTEFWRGKLEGHPSRDFNSTRYPYLKDRYHGTDQPSGRFGHGQ